MERQRKFADARGLLSEAEALLAREEVVHPVSVRIRWQLERGRLHVLEKTPSQARNLFAEAWTLATNSGEDCLAVEVAQMMAANESQKAQQAWIVRAIEIEIARPVIERSKSRMTWSAKAPLPLIGD